MNHTKTIVLGILALLTAIPCWPAAREPDDHPLFDAVMMSNFAEIQKLLAAGANIDEQGYRGYSALALAARESNALVAHMLINANANQTIQNDQNETALDIAIRNNDIAIINMLTNVKPTTLFNPIKNWRQKIYFDQKQLEATDPAPQVAQGTNSEAKQDCPICWNTPTELELTCKHSACQTCFKRMIQENLVHCPLCRAKFTETDLATIFGNDRQLKAHYEARQRAIAPSHRGPDYEWFDMSIFY